MKNGKKIYFKQREIAAAFDLLCFINDSTLYSHPKVLVSFTDKSEHNKYAAPLYPSQIQNLEDILRKVSGLSEIPIAESLDK